MTHYSDFTMEYQILSKTESKDQWAGPGIYRLVSAADNKKYLSVDDKDNLVVASRSEENNDYKQQWQISYAGKRRLQVNKDEPSVTEFLIINVNTGKYLTFEDDSKISMKLSSPKFDGDSRWVLHNPQITENDRTFNDRYGFYRCANNRALACNGAKITSIHYEPKDPNKNCQWFIVDKITS